MGSIFFHVVSATVNLEVLNVDIMGSNMHEIIEIGLNERLHEVKRWDMINIVIHHFFYIYNTFLIILLLLTYRILTLK